MAGASEHRARARDVLRERLVSGVAAELLTDEFVDQALEAARPHLAGWLAGQIHDDLLARADTSTGARLPLPRRGPLERPDPGEHLWYVTRRWPLYEHEILQDGLAETAHCAMCYGHYSVVGGRLCHGNLIREQSKVDSSARA